MTINERIRAALMDDEVRVCVPDNYTGTEDRYYTFSYFAIPAMFGDNRPTNERYIITVHYFCPLRENSVKRRELTRRRLYDAGFTWPTETTVESGNTVRGDATNRTKQHYEYTCECAQGVRYG